MTNMDVRKRSRPEENHDSERYRDRISDVPDDVLGLILFRLGLKEAARTSVLSKRWISARNLFPGPLVFDPFLHPLPYPRLRGLPDSILDARLHFISFVNRVLNSLTRPSFECLRVSFYLDSDSTSDLDNLFHFALRKRVQVLEVDCLHFRQHDVEWNSLPLSEKKMYSFPLYLFSRYSTFSSLKCLQLRCVEVSEEALNWILTRCPNLWSLSVGGMMNLVSLRVSVPSLRLTHLELNCRSCRNMTDLQISAGPLMSLLIDFPKDIRRFSIENMPRLIEASFSVRSGAYFIDHSARFFPLLSKLETLKLEALDQGWNYEVLQLHNLKHLELTIHTTLFFPRSLLVWSTFLKGAPFLQRLTVKNLINPKFLLNRDRTRELEKMREESPHQALKEVTIIGYFGSTRVRELIINYLVENTLSLQKIVVDTRRQHDGEIFSRLFRYETDRESALQFKSQLPTTLNYIVM